MFDTIVMVDWSGGKDRGPRPKKDAIWSAVVRSGAVETPRYHRNRETAVLYLEQLMTVELEAGRRVLAGFDFPFGYPAGFAAWLVGRADPLAVWDWFAAHLEDRPDGNDRFDLAGRINASFPGVGPFWFNGLKREIPDLPRKGRDRAGHGMAEKRRVEQLAKGSFSCWQMGGAGAVGSQAMTGMAALARLRRAFAGCVSVWPFEPLETPVALIEVWPSLVDTAVRQAQARGEIRDSAQVRVLAGALARMAEAGTLGSALDAVPADARLEEGWIFGVAA